MISFDRMWTFLRGAFAWVPPRVRWNVRGNPPREFRFLMTEEADPKQGIGLQRNVAIAPAEVRLNAAPVFRAAAWDPTIGATLHEMSECEPWQSKTT